MTSPDDSPENDPTFAGLSAVLASLLEDGSVLAARAKTRADAVALGQLGEDVITLSAAMQILARLRR
jgi:hypothetical protein